MTKKLNQIVKAIQEACESFGKSPFNSRQVLSRIKSLDPSIDTVDLLLEQMVSEGELILLSRGRYENANVAVELTGTLDMNLRGNGYVIPDDGTPDIFIPASALNQALNKDKVKVRLTLYKKGRQLEGEITEVMRRYRSTYAGRIEIQRNVATFIPDDRTCYVNFLIPEKQLNKAKDGQKVLVSITSWEKGSRQPYAQVEEILGIPGTHEAEMHAIIAEYGFANRFPLDVEKEAEAIPETIPQEEIAKRRDFRSIPTFTIDPEDAKDFDDALSFEKLEDGKFRIGVHIADVSHYVVPGTRLDQEAARRATSVYLVDRTIPMLPEKLSNGLCSLRPGEDKLTFSAVFEMDEQGKIYHEWFGKTIIHSDIRFSYEQAQEILEGKSDPIEEPLRILNRIAIQLKTYRFKQGAISFETEEVKFKLSPEGVPLGVYLKVRKDAHKLIEEFMLLANRKVAEHIGKVPKGNLKKTFVYRIHDTPNEERLDSFTRLAARFGHRVDMKTQKSLSRSLNHLLAEVEGKPEQNLLQSLAIRTMAKAEYTTKQSSHYGLAFDYYTHFTSPIRRYPDLMVHRLLEHYIQNKPSTDPGPWEEACKHSSRMEQQAAEAERASIKYKQVEYLQKAIGKTFEGIISGVTEWGIYVELKENKCEGMIRLSKLKGDFYEYDEENYCVKGIRRKKKYQLGDSIKIKVQQADMEKRQLDFMLADEG